MHVHAAAEPVRQPGTQDRPTARPDGDRGRVQRRHHLTPADRARAAAARANRARVRTRHGHRHDVLHDLPGVLDRHRHEMVTGRRVPSRCQSHRPLGEAART